jgi:flagellar assembly protein FliH
MTVPRGRLWRRNEGAGLVEVVPLVPAGNNELVALGHLRRAAEVRALEEADLIRARATEEAKRRVAEAEHGAIDGARKRAHQEVAELVVALESEKRRWIETERERIVELARHVAESLVGAQVAADDETAVTLVRRALRDAGGARRIVVRVRPEDAPRLTSLGAALDAEPLTDRTVDVVADENLGPGDVVLETDIGAVDARLETTTAQLALLLRPLLQ